MSRFQRFRAWLGGRIAGAPVATHSHAPRALPGPSRRAPAYEMKHASELSCEPGGGSASRSSGDPRWAFRLNLGNSLPLSLWVYNNASLIAGLAASVPLVATLNGVAQPDSDLQRLLDNPVPGRRIGGGEVLGKTQGEWMTERAYHLLLTGVDYLHLTRTKTGAQTRPSQAFKGVSVPAELWPYPQGQMITDVTEAPPHTITGYTRVEDALEISERDVIRARFVRPGDNARGLPPLEAAAREAGIDDAASGWQLESYENRAIPDGLLLYDEYLSDDQWREAQDQLRRGFAGAANARVPMVLGGVMKKTWVELSRTAVEMDFANSREITAEFICAAFKVPIVLFRSSDSTYANLETAQYMIWNQSVIPLINVLVDPLDKQLAPEFGPGWGVAADLSKVYAMLPMTRARFDLAERYMKHGMPMSVASEMFDLGVVPHLGWDVGYVDASRVPVEMLIAPGGPLPGDDEGGG